MSTSVLTLGSYESLGIEKYMKRMISLRLKLGLPRRLGVDTYVGV